MQRNLYGIMKIFDGISENEIKSLINCLQAVNRSYKKNEIIFDTDDEIISVAYILSGSVQLSKNSYEGSRIIIGNLLKNETFGEAMVCAGLKKSLICAKALEDTEILFLDIKKILSTCPNNCHFHKRLIENLVKIIAYKNIALQEKIYLLTQKTLREKVLYMLHNEKLKVKKDIFDIPYSREEMAEFLSTDRSSLSRELSKMKSEGILDYHKNSFKLI